MELRITHETHYDYAPAVEMAQHIAYLRPPDTPWQTVRQHALDIHPGPAHCQDTRDVYGNHRTFFSLLAPHTELRVCARTVILTRPPLEAVSNLPWEILRDELRYRAGAAWNPAAEYSFPSPRAPRDEAFAAYARSSFSPGASALDAARELMHRIHREFTYETNSTEVHTAAIEALEQRKGVCQDFAHIMIACLRSLGLPARYVSGYLLTEPPPGEPRLIGSDASHAWVSIYLPDLHEPTVEPDAVSARPHPASDDDAAELDRETIRRGIEQAPQAGAWYDLDPTNNRSGWGTPGADYVTLATGRDYADVSPMRGVIHGGSQHTLQVAVTVLPENEAAALEAAALARDR